MKIGKVAGALLCTMGVGTMMMGVHPIWGVTSMVLGSASYLASLFREEATSLF